MPIDGTPFHWGLGVIYTEKKNKTFRVYPRKREVTKNTRIRWGDDKQGAWERALDMIMHTC
jgi:hypothetical protein